MDRLRVHRGTQTEKWYETINPRVFPSESKQLEVICNSLGENKSMPVPGMYLQDSYNIEHN